MKKYYSQMRQHISTFRMDIGWKICINILFLCGDIAQLICFKKTVLKTEESFLIYCFPHQVSFLKTFFGDRVALRVIKLEQIENLLKVDEYFDD